MHTRCPDCRTVFLITEEQLGAAAGKARCGHCGEVFDARAALLPETPAQPSEATTATTATPEPASSAEPPSPADASPAPASAPAETPQAPPPAPAVQAPPMTAGPRSRAAEEAIPEILREDFEQARARRSGPGHGWAWAIAIVLLSAALVMEYAYFMRAQLVQQFPQTRPWLVRMCTALDALVGCQVPYPRDLSKLRVLASEVAQHPNKRNALLIQATFVNIAPFTQRYPVVEVKLTDLRGQTVALRRFRPTEYLHGAPASAQGLAPRTPVTALIEVARPFTDVEGYSFAFY